MLTIGELLSEAQKNIWELLRSSNDIKKYTKNVLDGVPLGLTSGTGFPYIIVPTPEIADSTIVGFGGTKRETIIFNIEIFDKKEGVLRKLSDAVRKTLETNSTLFLSQGLFKYKNSRGDLSYSTLEDNSVVYNYTLTIEYEWWDC